jgi:4-amino-4-deoxy-L-arabinose transferase-like glycosyltransferase
MQRTLLVPVDAAAATRGGAGSALLGLRLGAVFGDRRSTTAAYVLLAALTLTAAALRLINIEMDALWQNELFSIYWIRHSYTFLMTQGLVTETNPPLHFVLLKAWTGLFGTNAVSVRSLSVIASVACVPVTYMLGRELGGASVGLLGATLLAASPIQIYFADEARAYAMLPLLVALTLLGLCRFLRGSPLSPRGDNRASTQIGGLALYVAGGVALLYTHATSVFILASLFITMMLLFLDARLDWARIRAFLVATVVIGLIGAPAMVAMAWQARSPNIEWMPHFGLDQLMVTAWFLLVGPLMPNNLEGSSRSAILLTELGLACFAAIILLVVARGFIRGRLGMTMLLLFPVLFITLLCAVSVVRPILIPRVTLWMTVPISLSAGFVLMSRAVAALRMLGVLPLLGCMCFGCWNNVISPTEHKPDWPALLQDAATNGEGGEILVAGPHAGLLGVTFYSNGKPGIALRQWQPTPKPDAEITTAERLGAKISGAAPMSTAELAAVIDAGGHPRLFLDEGDTALIEPVVALLPRFAQARQHNYPGLTVFEW